MNSNAVYTGGPSVLTIVGIVFVVLKLVGTINWSWWWVLLPFYGPIVFVLLLFGLGVICEMLFHR